MTALVYQWRTGNRFELLIDGDKFFPRILSALDQAVERIDIELYLVDSGRSTRQWLEALQHARRRGEVWYSPSSCRPRSRVCEHEGAGAGD